MVRTQSVKKFSVTVIEVEIIVDGFDSGFNLNSKEIDELEVRFANTLSSYHVGEFSKEATICIDNGFSKHDRDTNRWHRNYTIKITDPVKG